MSDSNNDRPEVAPVRSETPTLKKQTMRENSGNTSPILVATGEVDPKIRTDAEETEARSKVPARDRNPLIGVGLGSDGVFMRPKGHRMQRDCNPVTGEGYLLNRFSESLHSGEETLKHATRRQPGNCLTAQCNPVTGEGYTLNRFSESCRGGEDTLKQTTRSPPGCYSGQYNPVTGEGYILNKFSESLHKEEAAKIPTKKSANPPEVNSPRQ